MLIITTMITTPCYGSLTTTDKSTSSLGKKEDGQLKAQHNKENLDKQLLKAARKGELEKVKKLINEGAHSNISDKNGANLLHLAVLNGSKPFIAYVVEVFKSNRFSDQEKIRSGTRKGLTALDIARQNKLDEDIIRMLTHDVIQETPEAEETPEGTIEGPLFLKELSETVKGLQQSLGSTLEQSLDREIDFVDNDDELAQYVQSLIIEEELHKDNKENKCSGD